MAGFTVPNANAVGTSIQSLDQAEPDSLDFSVLGNLKYGVLNGFDATISNVGNGSAAVTAGEVIIDGEYGYVTAATVALTAPAADPRFDLIVAQKGGGTFVLNTVVGASSATNPVFPTLANTQIILYALYRKSGETLNNNSVVDKRRFVSTTIRSGTNTPNGALGVDGDLYIRTSVTPAAGQASLYVKQGNSWQNLATYTGPEFEEPLNSFLLVGL
jgi:hypothetical protein